MLRGWLSELDRNRFRVFGYHTGFNHDGGTQMAARLCERFVAGARSLDAWRETILADRPHVLVYPELGMNERCIQLAAQRLAPVQCVSWGHPQTSGFPTIDHFLTSDLMEPADGADHYSEKLVRLPNISLFYEPPDIPAVALDRSEFGLRANAIVYWCAQSLFKYLPPYDSVFPRIAREVSDCQFVFISFQRQHGAHITDAFQHRLQRAFAEYGLRAEDHCVMLPPLSLERFLAAAGLCEIALR